MHSTGRQTWVEALEPRQLLSGINQLDGVGYLLGDDGTTIERYDIDAQQWLAPVTLANAPGGATAFLVDADGIYVAYDKIVMRYGLDGSAPNHLINTATTVHDLHTDGNLLFLNHSSSLYARFISISKQTNTIIDTAENYVESVYGSSISTTANRIIGRSRGISPSDITYIAYNDSGFFSGGGDSPYHGDYAGATTTWVFPQGTKVVDDSGGVYATSDLTRLHSFGTGIDDVTFLGSDVPIVLHDNTLTAYSAAILPTGSHTLSRPATQILVNDTNVIAFNPDATQSSGYDTQVVPLEDLDAPEPGEPVNPDGLPYTPDDIEVSADNTLLILDSQTQSIFRWDTATQEYGPTIPLIDVPRFMAYSEPNNTIYVAYPSGLINSIDLAAATPSEEPFVILPGTPLGLSTAGQYLFAADPSGAWESHYTFGPDGTLISAVDWNYTSTEYIWSEANSKMYFFRDGTSPNDLLWEEIHADGKIGTQRDSPLHTSLGFRHPIRVAPDGSIVILGSGMVHDAETLERLPGGLPIAVSDVAWLDGSVYTVRSIAGYTQFHEWVGPTFAPGSVKQVQGDPEALLSVGGNLVGIYTPLSGVPQFLVMNGNFNTDVTRPFVEQFNFGYETRQELVAAFSEDVADGVDLEAITVTNLDTEESVSLSAFSAELIAGEGGKTALRLVPAHPLADGNYRAVLPAGSVTDAAGNPLADDVTLDFFVLAGDANRDRRVDFTDFLTLRSNFGRTDEPLFSEADFNYDDKVDFADFLILRGQFGVSLPPPSSESLFAAGDGAGEEDEVLPG